VRRRQSTYVESKVEAIRAGGKQASYCIMNGQDKAHLLHADEKVPVLDASLQGRG